MRIVWVLGWAIPAQWFGERVREAFPNATHELVVADRGWEAKLAGWGSADWVVGYSLGAHLLLEAAPGIGGHVALLAPFLGFPSEAGQGGRISVTQVRYLERWIKRDRTAALADFDARAELSIPASAADRGSTGTLLWGLGKLAVERQLTVDVENRCKGWLALGGSADALLDATQVHRHLPSLEIVAGAGHEPRQLLSALASRIS